MNDPLPCFAPVSAESGKPLELAMQQLWLTGQLLPAGARLYVQHVFRSKERRPLEVIYCFPLPRDAALRRFRIAGTGFDVHSELRATEEAVRAYERSLADGSLATLARQFGDGAINLTVGNIRPQETVTVTLEIVAGVELRDDGFRFRFPFTLAPSYHAHAKSVVANGEGRIELPAEFGGVIMPRFREDASNLHAVGFDLAIADRIGLARITSPSHTVRADSEGGGPSRVTLAARSDLPDRDLVLDVSYHSAVPRVIGGRDAEGRGHFAAIVPSSSFGAHGERPRRVVFLLDRSGSMEGAPLAQASKAIGACLGALSERDSFGLIAFDDRVEVLHLELLAGSRENRNGAQQFLKQITARGGTELAQGFLEAVRLLNGGGGDVFILTDGQVAGTERILADARSTRTRLHCLGIGSASQDRFLALLARESGGVSRFVTPRERVDVSAVELFASIGRPVATGLRAGAGIQPLPPEVVFAGTPVLLFGDVTADAAERVELSWEGGQLSLPVSFDGEAGDTVRLLQGARLITDWECRYPQAAGETAETKIESRRVSARLRDLSRTYGLASREMSLVAVVQRAGDRRGEVPKTQIVPVGMAQDTAFGSYFAGQMGAAMPAQAAPMAGFLMAPASGFTNFFRRAQPASSAPTRCENPEDLLLDLAARMESDGGMPGKDSATRVGATAAAVLAFLSQGHSARSGAFRWHVARLVRFLETDHGLSTARRTAIDRVIEMARDGRATAGDWLAIADSGRNIWKELEAL